MEMEWNAKWDWENLGVFGSKAIESPKNLQLADWTIVDDGDIHAGSFNLSSSAAAPAAGGGSSGSSAKSSISASTDSTIFKLSTSDGKKVEMSRIASPTGETSVGSAEALLGLKLGKRTYFENSGGGGGGGGGGAKSAAFPTPSIMSSMKKTRSSGQNGPVCCQVEGCSVDLALAKEYHRKHRVCDTHSKCPKVIVGGRERRFCQQCSRFHSLCEFDEKKRSCRRRLSDHNARRRKPQQETIQFNPSRLSTPFYGGSQQQMNFMLNNSALRPPPANSWNNSSRFTLTKGCWLKSDDGGGTDEQLRMAGINGFLASKNPVSKGSSLMSSSSSLDAAAAPEYRRALSLLSTNSWSSCVPESVQLQQQQQQQQQHQLHENGSSIIHHHHHQHQHPMVHGIPEGVPFPSSSSELWPHHHLQSFKTPTPYDTSTTDFYSNVLN